jgi:hypothetical protein
MPTPGGGESRLRSLAITALLVAVSVYLAVHLIAAVVPELIVFGAVAVVGYVVWLMIKRRRW